MTRYLLTTLAAVIILAACSTSTDEPSLSVEDPWVRASMIPMSTDGEDGDNGDDAAGGHRGAGNSAAYMMIKNRGKGSDRLVGVASVEDIAEFVEMHRSEMKDGVMTMNPVESIDIPAGGEAALEPGGLHIMLINLNRTLDEGDKIDLVLEFEKSDSLTIEAEVRAP